MSTGDAPRRHVRMAEARLHMKEAPPRKRQPLPPFDDSRKALVFALNAHDVQMPRPTMNRAMAAGAKKAQTKAQAKREAKARKARMKADPLLALEEAPDVLEGTRRSNYDGDLRARARSEWLGLQPEAQAGLILREFGKLDREHRVVLEGLLTRSHAPCSCRSPCCSGMAPEPRWVKAVDETCDLLKESVDLVRVPGKKGLSSQPALRRRIVEQFYTKDEGTLVMLAERVGLTTITAAKHKAWIVEGLQRIEDEAWQQLDAMFAAAGITGTIVE